MKTVSSSSSWIRTMTTIVHLPFFMERATDVLSSDVSGTFRVSGDGQGLRKKRTYSAE